MNDHFLALARVAPVVAVDWDRLRLAILATNAEVLGFDDRVMLLQADLINLGLRFPPRSGAQPAGQATNVCVR
ncbi:MAG: hypothetical protein E3J37_06710 [Anaerolineales bacterium]|nr:MAG: hypothetical protein E3J37_06710 [Anaerolineales bacterium]